MFSEMVNDTDRKSQSMNVDYHITDLVNHNNNHHNNNNNNNNLIIDNNNINNLQSQYSELAIHTIAPISIQSLFTERNFSETDLLLHNAFQFNQKQIFIIDSNSIMFAIHQFKKK